MIDLLGIGAGAFGLSWIAYQYGQMRSNSDEGCNGHHWGEPYRPDEDGISSTERKRAGLDRETVQRPSNHLTAKVLSDTVVVRGKAIKKCQDCGERKVVDITVGTADLDVFEDDE